jgi:hypothetical protein
MRKFEVGNVQKQKTRHCSGLVTFDILPVTRIGQISNRVWEALHGLAVQANPRFRSMTFRLVHNEYCTQRENRKIKTYFY